ncbi:MAG: energy-coupling factor ABC transporter ATP-binding protein [Bryobacteraceae bacterium]
MVPLIEIRNLHFRYPDGTKVLSGIEFQLYPGETVAVLGPNGSGKTTFLLHLNGLLQGEGEVRICGMPVSRANLAVIRRKVGLVFQDPNEQLFMPTVLEDVAFGPLNLGIAPQEALQRARETLMQVGLQGLEQKAPYRLSEGEKRRVALAGVLAMEPEILVLDEPTTFLDPPGQKQLLHLLRALPQAKVVVTHQTSVATYLAQRAVFFREGRIIDSGPVRQVLERYKWLPPA